MNTQRKISGYIMASVGLAILVASALGYILNWNFKHPSLTLLGLIFVTIGLKNIRLQ